MPEERKSALYHYLESGEHLVFCAPWFRREGLCLFIYNDHDLAVAAAADKARLYGYDIDLGETDDIVGLLRRMSDLGFAGAVLNDLVPVIFCRDPEGLPVFLSSLQNHEGGFSHFERLLDDGSWEVSVAVESVAPLQDQHRFDRLIAGLVGEVPFRGYHDDWTAMTWCDVTSGEMPVIDAAEGAVAEKADALSGRTFLPIFSDFDYLEQFVSEREIDPATIKRRDVEDLSGLAQLAAKRKALVLLNPGQHRADTAALGWRENGVALTSFSGRWISTDGRTFRTDRGVAAAEAAKPEGPPKNLAEEMAQREKQAAAAVAIPEPEPVELPVVAFDTSAEAVVLEVAAEQVESGSVNEALTVLCSAFGDPDTLRWAAGRFNFSFAATTEGQDPFADPAVRDWFRALERFLPVLTYFLSTRLEGGLMDVARALLEEQKPDFPQFVEDRALMIQAMGEKYRVETRPACEALAAAFSHQLPVNFFIDPESF